MLPACNRGAGANIHFPDVCLTPPRPVPIPYVDTGYNSVATAFVPHIFICGLNAHNLGTVLAVTTGDEQGSVHWTTRGFSKYVQGNPIVFVGKLPGVHLTCRSIGNKGNAAVGMCQVPSAVNVFYTLRAGEGESEGEGEGEGESEGVRGGEGGGMAEDPRFAMMRRLPVTGPEAERLVEATFDGERRELSIRIERLGSSTPLAVRRALDAHALETLVLDLRGNPGGDLDAAVRIAELLLPRGRLVGFQCFGDGTRRALRTRLEPAFDGPVRVLVDGGTASAAEVLAAALKHHRRAEIVGVRTYGKGSVQTFTPDGLQTVAFVVDPEGAAIEHDGVAPSSAMAGAPLVPGGR